MPVAPKARAARAPSLRTSRGPMEKGRWAAKGTKPLPDPASVQYVITLVIVHVCRKVLFIETEVKIALYSIGLFAGSLICDFLPLPKPYLAQKDNIFNIYFVKLGWGWLFLVVGSFIFLTNYTVCCGQKEIIKRHLYRLLIGTCVWYFWTRSFFEYVENKTGSCLGKAIIRNKYHCNDSGFHWHSFDISGHAFLLVYMNLLLVEEAKAIVGWESIRDLIRKEDHNRTEGASNEDDVETSLKGLSEDQFIILKDNYESNTPYIRLLFIGMTIMSVLSDVMLTITIIFWHTMPQKVAGGAIAIISWWLTYRFWYKSEISPGLPGTGGLFSYRNWKQEKQEKKEKESNNRRRSSISKEYKDLGATFMGMPLNPMQKQEEKKKEREREREREVERELDDHNGDTDPLGLASDVRSSARNMTFAPFKGDSRMFGDPSSARAWRRGNL